MTILLSSIQFSIVLFLLLSSKFKTGNSLTLIPCMAMIWLVHSILANSGYTGFYPLSEKANLLITLYLLGYAFSFCIFNQTSNKYGLLVFEFRKIIIEKLIINLSLILTIFLSIVVLIYSIIASIDLQSLRDIIYSSDNPYSAIISPIIWIVTGLFFYLFLFSFYAYFSGKIPKWYVIASILNIILFNLSSGGRTSIIYLLILLASSWILIRKNIPRPFNIIKINATIKKGLYSIIIVIISITVIRSGGDITSIYYTYNKYFIGSFVAMSEFIDVYNLELQNVRFGYSLMGLDTFTVSGLCRFIFNIDIPSILSQVSGAMHHGVYISNDIVTNAHYTILTSFYWDYGYAGAFLIGFLSCSLFIIFHNKFYRTLSFGYFTLTIFMILLIVYSIRTNILLEPQFFIMFIFIFIRTKLAR
uniref:Wzy n=1 Tax=Providencia alcalifaciens TaxID=126385 RepID=A0A346CLI9_9GAMM|nr:Wzy [Providencia alcalifaciens]